MFSSKFLQATKMLMSNGSLTNPALVRYSSTGSGSDADKCAGYSGKPTGKCAKKVAMGCRTPNASVKCVSLSMEVPCEKIKPLFPSFLEMLQSQDVFHLQKSCPNECCCLANYISLKKINKISWTDLIHVKTRC